MTAPRPPTNASGCIRKGFVLAALLLGLLWQPLLSGFAAQPVTGSGSAVHPAPAGAKLVRSNVLTITWLETGASLAVALETPSGKVFLMDTGGVRKATASAPDYNAGRDTISPFLKKRGYARMDGILISHTHGDHIGGAQWLMEHWKVGQFVDHGYPATAKGMPATYPRLREMAAKDGGTYRVVRAGDTLAWDAALQVEVLAPAAGTFDKPDDGSHNFLNMSSIVLRVQHGRNVFLFPGDAYHAAKDIPARKLKCVVLTSPHHGFHPDSSNFTKLSAPKYVVVTCAADYPSNAGTPYPRSPGGFSVEKYGALGIETFVTAFDGDITARSDGQTVKLARQRARVIPP
ncbi:MAG: MBL fold metallo-hydrolase [Verrucomicrobia bacterium]|nr:MBL fold metallo-hydrolase [Verrucomicrobiota bacterium]